MRNGDLINEFVRFRGNDLKGSNLKLDENKLINYTTIIAYRIAGVGIVLNKTKYSSTTSVHQNRIRHEGKVVLEVSEDQINRLARGTITYEELCEEVEFGTPF